MDSCARFDHLTPRSPDTAAIARAAQRRNPTAVSVVGKTPRISRNNEFEPWDAGHTARQEFRRLLDPGILQNNDKNDAAKSLRFLNRVTENILKNPDNPKYQRLKINKDSMKQHVMSKRGTVEFLQKVGFREQIVELDTMLVFNPKRMDDLRTGARCLDEVIKNQVQTIEDAERAKRQAIANEKAAKTKVMNAVRDDRQRVAARVERERLAREQGGAEQAEADDNPEPPVAEMSSLSVTTPS